MLSTPGEAGGCLAQLERLGGEGGCLAPGEAGGCLAHLERPGGCLAQLERLGGVLSTPGEAGGGGGGGCLAHLERPGGCLAHLEKLGALGAPVYGDDYCSVVEVLYLRQWNTVSKVRHVPLHSTSSTSHIYVCSVCYTEYTWYITREYSHRRT